MTVEMQMQNSYNMKDVVTIEGTISGQPRRRGEFTEFSVECSPRCYHVIRVDKQWQIKDLIFLCEGQHLRVAGRMKEEKILANQVEILDCSVRNYNEERQYGNSCVTGTDPGDPQV